MTGYPTRAGEDGHALVGSIPSPTARPPGMDARSHRLDEHALVTVTGEVDNDTAPDLQRAILAVLDDSRSRACVVDLTRVDFLNSAGLAALVTAHNHAEGLRESLRIVVDSNSPVIRPIEVTGLDVVLRLYHTIDEALDAANRRPRH
ncbi:STAS domain-containing protein [Amycolatopsis roodepoortensis]|uniref:Anti-sigma factor antagonist n=1 Tax=Amycolatopsis roodepoortensis TaxID=700274 RepID=A0ABR9LG83_9PSEU|nr:STAS domain-containing protein [Amycolatopsis roodepoortensis]MBE1579708.1 anti-sigma B factor antagonist [Amycolatopsis roodepoortensis]